MTLSAAIARCSALPMPTVRESPVGDISDADAAILFVMALWSAPSLAAFRRLTAHLARSPDPAPLVVCNTDELSPQVRAKLEPQHGYGETFWLRQGHVVAVIRDHRHLDDAEWARRVDGNCALLFANPG